MMAPKYPRFLNGAVHQWYRMVLGYPDHLVANLIRQLDIRPGARVLDPFCGSGTTLIECMKHNLQPCGLDANPASVLATRVKTDWGLNPTKLRSLQRTVAIQTEARLATHMDDHQTDPTYAYLRTSGMLDRGWISELPLKKAIALKRAIASSSTSMRYREAMTLCLLADVVYGAANVKFGPEVYCAKPKLDFDVVADFSRRIHQMADDLESMSDRPRRRVTVLNADARTCDSTLGEYGKFDACISSPPYPAEHDYTRNARLELAFLESVTDLPSLRKIKKSMIRSHSKNIYKYDTDAAHVKRYRAIQALAEDLERRVHGKRGFVGLYPDVVRHYFGGMKRHFVALRRVLAPRARCAYVVGDQSSYCGVRIPTADVMSTILRSTGYRDVSIRKWRGRWSTTRSREISENIVFFTKSEG